MYSLSQAWKSLSVVVIACFPVFSVHALENDKIISIGDVTKIVTDQGFTDIRKIELSDDNDEYEIKARDPKGQKVEIEINAATGKIKEVERD